ncbi:hypothetical protein D5S17_00380 [Pseudonocardiaceae bacterium YIM PH 21723]|nr:hypothetical protein D5S17_00380 [Pseudonocardiaceae bacterium YIM PH 21723]
MSLPVEELTEVESAVLRAFAAGTEVNRATLAMHGITDQQPEVRAEALMGMLIGLYPIEPVAVPALRLKGCRITGVLDLEGATVGALISFTDCVLDKAPMLRMATLAGLRLRGSRMPGLRGRNLRVDSDLVLEAGFSCAGPLDLTDARVQGTLRLAGSVLKDPRGHALLGARLHITGSLQGTAMRTQGEVRLRGAQIGGSVHLGGAQLSHPTGDALEASGVVISGNLFCDGHGGRFTADGRIVLLGARIGGDAVLSRARLRQATVTRQELVMSEWMVDDRATLVADRIRVEGNLQLDDGFEAAGTVRLPNARVGGYLRLSGATLCRQETTDELLATEGDRSTRKVPVALLADGIHIAGDLEARARPNGSGHSGVFTAYGQVRLLDAEVRGSASLGGARLYGPTLDVLFADRLRVGGTLFLRKLMARGSVRLQNARIGSTLDCSGAVLVDPRTRPDGSVKPSLDARAIGVGKDLLCGYGFTAAGGVRIRMAEIGKMVTFVDAVLGAENCPIALNANGIDTQQLVLRFGDKPAGRVILSRAKAVSVEDNENLWTATGGLDLEDFTYESLVATPDIDIRTRLTWLHRALPAFVPGPYEQLAAMYRDTGDEERAEHVQLAKLQRRHRSQGPASQLWGNVQMWTVGYGYRPWLAVLWLSVFWVGGALWFSEHRLDKLDTDQNPVWSPWVLSADLLLPIVNLGQDGMWRITGSSQWIAELLTAAGWILASTAAAGATRVLKRA